MLVTRPCNQPSEELTQRDWLQLLLPWTVHMKSSEEQVAGTCPSNSNWSEFVGLVAGTRSLRLDFEAKMASSHDGTCPHDLLQKYLAIIQPFWHHGWSTTHINTVPNLLSCIMLDYFKNIFPILFYFKLKTSCFGFALVQSFTIRYFKLRLFQTTFCFPREFKW